MYSENILRIMKEKGINIGDMVLIKKGNKKYEGILMPRTGDNENVFVIKLRNGYNVGIKFEDRISIEKTDAGKKEDVGRKTKNITIDKNKPTISILHTGGTIASRVDYRTGGVVSSVSPEDLLEIYPELFDFANFRSRQVLNIFSEDMRLEHHQIIARAVEDEIKKGCDGIIITHGTDTMHYTSSMLSFMLQDLPVPVILVGAQRSSDRGSSDAALNLVSAVRFIAETDFSGIGICMHENSSDKSCLILPACKSRKLHTSRRDAFKAVNALPIARVSDKIEFFVEYPKKNRNRKVKLQDKFEKKVALLKITPNLDPGLIEFFIKNNYKGLVLEGTGLGHSPVNQFDNPTKMNRQIFEALKKACEKMVVVMTSQCIFGRVNMNVYSTGRDLQKIGIVPGEDMLPETAFVKLAWLLGNYPDKAKELIGKNIAGEISERSEYYE